MPLIVNRWPVFSDQWEKRKKTNRKNRKPGEFFKRRIKGKRLTVPGSEKMGRGIRPTTRSPHPKEVVT
jgi:hypothetical protein